MLDDAVRADAAELVAKGASVALIDRPDRLTRFADKDATGCHYVRWPPTSTGSPGTISRSADCRTSHCWAIRWVATHFRSPGPSCCGGTQSTAVLIGLLTLAPKAALEVKVTGWLGLSSSDAIALEPSLSKPSAERVVCVYGKEEVSSGESACPLAELGAADRVERDGGHHFDGDYDAIAIILLGRIAAAAHRSASQ